MTFKEFLVAEYYLKRASWYCMWCSFWHLISKLMLRKDSLKLGIAACRKFDKNVRLSRKYLIFGQIYMEKLEENKNE